MSILYIDTALIVTLILLAVVCIYSLFRLHKKSCTIYEKQIEIEKLQVELKYELNKRKNNSIFS
jgi:cbb3-type cytochrome oxidase subunit 3